MQYREDKYGSKISVLGYGCMCFTQKAGKIFEKNSIRDNFISSIDFGVFREKSEVKKTNLNDWFNFGIVISFTEIIEGAK